jgi:uncharacterized protein HemX
MFKRWFEFSSHNNGKSSIGLLSSSSANQGLGLMDAADERRRPAPRPAPEGAKPADFDQIYRNSVVKPPDLPYTILKVVDMLGNSHLKGMTTEVKRCALLMALEAAGAGMEDLLQDAMVRQRALNDYGEKQQERLSRFEADKGEENRAIQAELDRITNQYMARIQANVDEVARQQDGLLAWQKRKQEESQRIADAAAYLVPEAGSPNGNGLTAVLERASQTRRLA